MTVLVTVTDAEPKAQARAGDHASSAWVAGTSPARTTERERRWAGAATLPKASS